MQQLEYLDELDGPRPLQRRGSASNISTSPVHDFKKRIQQKYPKHMKYFVCRPEALRFDQIHLAIFLNPRPYKKLMKLEIMFMSMHDGSQALSRLSYTKIQVAQNERLSHCRPIS